MISANELRIGNYLEGKDKKAFQVQLFHINKISCNKTKLYAIPITEEWLLKFGFDRMEKFPLRYVNKMKDDSLTDFEPVIVVGDMWLKKLKYIHQLQNLYFALTQTELQIK